MKRQSNIRGATIGRPRALPVIALVVAFGLATIASAGAASAESADRAAAKTRADVADKLVGTWRLKTTLVHDQSGNAGPFYHDPVGKLTYTPRGDMWAVVGNRGEPGVWYTGAFEVSPKAHTVVHHVEHSSILDWEGTDLVREYKFLNRNRLRLTAEVNPTSQVDLTWKRA
jgi:Lipocalin-like domain